MSAITRIFSKKRMHKVHNTIITLLACLVLTACSAHYGAAYIETEPPGAEVINDKDGNVIGITPLTYVWEHTTGRNQNIIVKFKKDGYYPKDHGFWLAMRHRNQKDALNEPERVKVVLRKIGE